MSNLDDALNYFKQATITVDDFLLRVDRNKPYDYKNTNIYKGMLSLQAAANEPVQAPLTVESLISLGVLKDMIVWSALPSEMAKIEFIIDGVVKYTSNTNPFTFNFDTTKLTNGSHNFSVRATAADGRVATVTVPSIVQNP